MKKCPRCFRSAIVNSIRIRSSPRKNRKSNIFKISTASSSGRIQKQRKKTFLEKPSIDSPTSAEQLYVTFPMLDDGSSSTSPTSSHYTSPSSDESSGNEMLGDTTLYEYGECSGPMCNFKFCVKCNCKYHPRQLCRDFSPVSPTRPHINRSYVACSNKSKKSLKRLIY